MIQNRVKDGYYKGVLEFLFGILEFLVNRQAKNHGRLVNKCIINRWNGNFTRKRIEYLNLFFLTHRPCFVPSGTPKLQEVWYAQTTRSVVRPNYKKCGTPKLQEVWYAQTTRSVEVVNSFPFPFGKYRRIPARKCNISCHDDT